MSEQVRSEEEMNNLLSKVRFFPGSLQEYEAHFGYPVEVIDLKERDFGVAFGIRLITGHIVPPYSTHHKRILVDNGIEALVNCVRSHDSYYGLPVAKKKEDKK